MKRIAPLVIVISVIAISSGPLHAQRGGGGHAGGSGGRAGGANRGRVMHTPSPPSTPIPSADHPLPYNFNAVRPAPLLGRDPIPAPFSVRPGYYSRQHPFIGVPYGAFTYGYGYAPDYGAISTTPPPPPQDDMGLLFLEVTPSTAMVFADTAFVGSVFDLRSGLRLPPGHHSIDLEATGYDRKTFEVSAAPGQPVRYQTDLTPVRTASLAPAAPHPPQTMYAIPGCYGGNTPPVPANLPKGCDIVKVRILRPPQ